METAIYITEVAKREKQDWIEAELRKASDEANPGLYRQAFKMATGSGKTVVMVVLDTPAVWNTSISDRLLSRHFSLTQFVCRSQIVPLEEVANTYPFTSAEAAA